MRQIARILALAVFSAISGERVHAQDFRVLIFSKTAGFRHSSIPDGIDLIQNLGTANNFAVDTTEDAADFNLPNLLRYRVVVWLNTTGDVLNDSQQAAFESFIRTGRGYVGLHSATDTEYQWPWYGQLVGGNAWFANHPFIQSATLVVEDNSHPSTAHLPASGVLTDEWYNFQANPRPFVDVLVTIDESTYSGGNMGDHPMTWCHEFDVGRSWYTALGHRSETYQQIGFQRHLLGGILWSASGPAQVPALPPLGVLLLALTVMGAGACVIARARGSRAR